MSLFWKQLAGMLTVIILSFTVFGTVLLQTSFQSLLEKEKESGLEEVRMLQYAFLTAVEGMEENYALDERNITRLAESVAVNAGGSQNEVCVYDKNGQGIYPRGRVAGELCGLLEKNSTSGSNCAWRLQEQDGSHFMEAAARMDCEGKIYYLQVRRDIQYIYDSRESGYRNYRSILLILTAVAALFSAVFAVGYTAPIRRLSLAARTFSRGEYSQRVKPAGNDEITVLMQDFNGMAEKLESNIRELKENARQQEEFTGAFAHELKTPLTSIIGYAEMLMTMEMGEEELRQSADYIYREGKRLERLSHKMMELIRIGKLGIDMQPLQVKTLEENLSHLVAAKVAEKNINFTSNMEPGVISGDLDLLLSLMGNLVDNSSKACETGGTICVTGTWENTGEMKEYMVKVQDDGRGMPEDEVDRITEAFYMIDKSRARKEGGAGLGMAICSRIIEVHNARWEITSRLQEGSSVIIHFPAENTKKEAVHE